MLSHHSKRNTPRVYLGEPTCFSKIGWDIWIQLFCIVFLPANYPKKSWPKIPMFPLDLFEFTFWLDRVFPTIFRIFEFSYCLKTQLMKTKKYWTLNATSIGSRLLTSEYCLAVRKQLTFVHSTLFNKRNTVLFFRKTVKTNFYGIFRNRSIPYKVQLIF